MNISIGYTQLDTLIASLQHCSSRRGGIQSIKINIMQICARDHKFNNLKYFYFSYKVCRLFYLKMQCHWNWTEKVWKQLSQKLPTKNYFGYQKSSDGSYLTVTLIEHQYYLQKVFTLYLRHPFWRAAWMMIGVYRQFGSPQIASRTIWEILTAKRA